jgi:hypothetical protein
LTSGTTRGTSLSRRRKKKKEKRKKEKIMKMSKKYDVCVVGATGAVGETILSILDERDFPINNLYPLASKNSAGKLKNSPRQSSWQRPQMGSYTPSIS